MAEERLTLTVAQLAKMDASARLRERVKLAGELEALIDATDPGDLTLYALCEEWRTRPASHGSPTVVPSVTSAPEPPADIMRLDRMGLADAPRTTFFAESEELPPDVEHDDVAQGVTLARRRGLFLG